MREIQLRVPLGVGKQLHDVVFAADVRERVVFCLVSHVESNMRTLLLVRRIVALCNDAYVDDAACGAAWRGSAMTPVIDAAMTENLGIVVVHAHAFGDPPRLSKQDRESAERLLPMFARRVPQQPHASVVLSPGNPGAVVVFPGRPIETVSVSVRWMGTSIIDWPGLVPSAATDETVFDRQGLVVGEQGLLTRARVAVVGLCGGGSHIVQQLAHAGVGTIVGVDDDVSHKTNRHRSIGMTARDAARAVKKTTVMSRVVRDVSNGTRFIGVDARVPEAIALDALKSADVIVGCVDNLHARADLQEAAWRYLIPYVDVGANIRALPGNVESARASIGGNVYVFIPGGFCAWCSGFISEPKLDEERGGHNDRSYFENKHGEAQVISFNGLLASSAVGETVQLLSGYRGASLDPVQLLLPEGTQRGALKLDGRRGTLEDWGSRRRPECACCNELLGAGHIVWKAAS